MTSLIGQTISHYKILAHLGGGGMGVVYKARDTKLDRTVALKFLSPELTGDPHARKRFIREAQAASALDHVNVCSIYDIVEEKDSGLCIVMACYEGETLKSVIARGPLSIPSAIDVTAQIAGGLAAAHQHGILHRDINPTNIMVMSDGVVKILDFGLAKLIDRTQITGEGSTMGTIPYMSPEALTDQPLDTRTDIWALGVVLFEMLTGKLPFAGEHPAAMMYSIVNEVPFDTNRYREGIPEALQELCKRCLQKERDFRPQSMVEVISLLGVPAGKRRSGWLSRLRRRMEMRTVLLLIGIPLIVAAGWYALFYHTPGPAALPARLRVAILPFRVATDSPTAPDWGRDLQSLFAGELLGIEWLGVVDPLSLNHSLESSFGTADLQRESDYSRILQGKGVDLAILGDVHHQAGRFRIQTNVVDPSKDPWLVRYTSSESFAGGEEVQDAIAVLAQRITDFMEVQVIHSSKDEDLRPWLEHRKSNMPALKALMQATEAVYSGDNAEASRYIHMAIALDSTFVSPRIWLIPDLLSEGKEKEAEEQYRYLRNIELAVNPFERTMIRWVDAYMHGDFLSQISYLQQALAYSPGNNILLINLAYDQYILKDFHGAVATILPCLEMKWRYPHLYTFAAACYIASGDYAQGRRVLEEAPPIAHSDPRTYGMLAALALRDHDSTLSARYAALYIQRMGESGAAADSIYAGLGLHYSQLGLFSKAAELYQEAVAAKPGFAGYQEKLGQALYDEGRMDQAYKVLSRALELDPGLLQAHQTLGALCARQGDRQGALRHYRVFLSRDSTSPAADTVRSCIKSLLQ